MIVSAAKDIISCVMKISNEMGRARVGNTLKKSFCDELNTVVQIYPRIKKPAFF